ncbi:MAG: nicotinate-nucleotide--dimethylbenzimidazole phosphoribosyltransferase [Alphaproteobacteria bacterium]|nr:nicotinate-nucleotide--dimethylbenzimidazole phosphoribosyltransferase [Alphaproteobacteria bacterium]
MVSNKDTNTLEWARNLLAGLPGPDESAREAAAKRQAQLTKPAGSLGRLEELVLWLAAWQGKHPPTLDRPHVIVFAGNHGIAAKGVSAYPADVTAQMVANFNTGGAAINALSRYASADLSIIPIKLEQPTEDFTNAPAMSEQELADTLDIGRNSIPDDADLLLLGEMGIGNTTSAAALACALFGGVPSDWVGAGTGVDADGISRKQQAIVNALAFHGDTLSDPFEALRCVGGRELTAIAGACLEARRRRIPVILDGYVSTVSAAVLSAFDSSALDHCCIGHVSAEPGHRRLLERLGKPALLDLDMRLGEASGAAVALSVIGAALATHNNMATFEEAGIAGRSDLD